MEVEGNFLEILRSSGCIEGKDEVDQRKAVLALIENVFKDWLSETYATKDRASDKTIPSTSPAFKLLTLGSYELGIQNPGGDIDILIIVSSHVSRNDLFDSFFGKLQKLCSSEKFCNKVEKTYVPVIKTTLMGVDLDFAFTRFPTSSLPTETDMMDDMCLHRMDLDSVRSLNGWRDCIEIKTFVQNRLQEYQTLLQFLKFWATRRGIYNNSIGYFSGMAIMVLLAKNLMENLETKSELELLQLFFRKYSKWDWPRPVMLRRCEANTPEAPVLQVWNPQMYSFDKDNRMPIITPAYPQRNASFTLSMSTRKIIISEFERDKNKAGDEEVLVTLVQPQDFFNSLSFRTYIILRTESKGTDLSSHLDWCSVVRSQIRKLVSGLEMEEYVNMVYPFANSFPRPQARSFSVNHFCNQWAIGVSCSSGSVESILQKYIQEFQSNVDKYAKDHDISITGKSVEGDVIPKEELSFHLPDGLGHGIQGYTQLTEYKKGFFYFRQENQ